MKPTETLYYWHTQKRPSSPFRSHWWNGSAYAEACREIKKFPIWERIWYRITNLFT